MEAENSECADKKTSPTGTIKRAVGIIMVATLVSRLLGWVKLTSMSSLYGRTLQTEVFFGAFAIPDLVYLLVSGGAMTAAFIPIFTEFITTGREKEGWRFASTVWNMTAIVLLTFIVLGEVFAHTVVLLLPGFRNNPEALGYAQAFVRLLFPMLIFTALAALCNGVLHSYNHFTAPSVSWVIYNVFFIGAAWAFKNSIGLRGICIGVVAGALAMVLVQLPVMIKKGMHYSLTLDWRNPAVAQYWKIFLPIMLGMSLTQINLMIMPPIFGSIVGHGAITALNYANRIMFIPLGMFGSAISMAIFPTMSRQGCAGETDKLGQSLTRGVRATLIFSLPCTALMITAGLPAIRLVLGYGKFNYNDCYDTAFALSFFAIGLMGHSANQVINRGFYARKDSLTPVFAGIAGIAITIPLAYFLIKTPLRHGGIALAISIATLFNMVLLQILAKRKLGTNLMSVGPMFLKTLAASAAMGGVGWWVGRQFHLGPDNFGFQTVVAAFFAICASSGIVFALLAKLLRIEEFDEMLGMVLKKFGRGRPAV
jgi:putative peptidoglycan lipid II flippase